MSRFNSHFQGGCKNTTYVPFMKIAVICHNCNHLLIKEILSADGFCFALKPSNHATLSHCAFSQPQTLTALET
jgi:hypothetical protein